MFRADRGVSPLLLWALLPLWPWSIAGCDQLDEFSTGAHAVYSGEIIGSDSDQDTPSFIRQGFASHTRMTLTFDPALASAIETDAGREEAPGTIDTYVCPGSNDDCNVAARAPMDFDHAPLERISNLMHDALSEYDFPGGGRLRNYVFFARTHEEADAATSQRVATVFVSLLDNGRIEVRVVAPSVLDSDGETEVLPPLFGVFVLKRHAL
jgi:hypothetical protein